MHDANFPQTFVEGSRRRLRSASETMHRRSREISQTTAHVATETVVYAGLAATLGSWFRFSLSGWIILVRLICFASMLMPAFLGVLWFWLRSPTVTRGIRSATHTLSGSSSSEHSHADCVTL